MIVEFTDFVQSHFTPVTHWLVSRMVEIKLFGIALLSYILSVNWKLRGFNLIRVIREVILIALCVLVIIPACVDFFGGGDTAKMLMAWLIGANHNSLIVNISKHIQFKK